MKKLIIPVTAIALLFSACKKDEADITPHDDHNHNEEELITTVFAEFVPSSGSSVTLKFSDPDGPGGNNGTTTGDTLSANTSYKLNVYVLNESKNPVDSINSEIISEGDEHQLFFQSTSTDSTSIETIYFDKDKNGLPIGLCSNATTGKAGSGSFKITLRHQPNKTGNGVKDGNIANAGGDTDIEVDLPFIIK